MAARKAFEPRSVASRFAGYLLPGATITVVEWLIYDETGWRLVANSAGTILAVVLLLELFYHVKVRTAGRR